MKTSLHASLTPDPSGPSRRWMVLTLVLQFIGSVVAGAGVAYLGMELGFRLFAANLAGFGDIIARLGGILIGYPIGCGLGAWLVGRWRGLASPLWAGLVGGVGGVSLIFLFFTLFPSGELILGWLLLFACGALGAVALSWVVARRKGQPTKLGADHT